MKRLFTICILFWSCAVSSQDREAAIWHFGQYAGINFNSLTPQSLIGAAFDTFEGCSTISAENGRLVFYTDGEDAYNRSHRKISGSRHLLGSNFSTQSALIVPNPSNPTSYFLFTTDDYETVDTILWTGEGLNYYSVNMAGPGGIRNQKNHLITYDPGNKFEKGLKCSQKLTAIKNPCKEIYWLITHFKDSFYAFKIDENGVDETPVISKIGPEIFLGAYTGNAKGQIKMSPDGTKLAMANFMNSIDLSGHSPGSLYLFDFDIDTGMLSNEQKLMDDDFVFAYGVEFSPDSKKVYATVSSFKNGNVPPSGHSNNGSVLVQVDLENNLSYQRIYDSPVDPTALQLAIDGKIYHAHQRRRELGVINNPKEVGAACNYVEDGLPISRSSQKGLPSFVQSFFQVRIEYEEACEGFETKLSTNYLPEPDNIRWDFGDGSPPLDTVDKNPEHIYSHAGTYIVSATITKGTDVETYTKEVMVTELPNAVPATLTQCDPDGDGFSEFNLNEAAVLINPDPTLTFGFFLTERQANAKADEIVSSHSFSNTLASQVFVRVENEFGCYRVTTLNLNVVSTSIPSGFNLEIRACDDAVDSDYTDGIGTFDFSSATTSILALFSPGRQLTVSYYESMENALSETNIIDPLQYRNKNAPFSQDIWVRVDGNDQNDCIGLGQHITLVVDEAPSFELEPNLEICSKQLPYTVRAENPLETYTYQWSNEDGDVLGTNQNFAIPQKGTYTLIATKTDGTGCETSRTIEVTSIDPPVLTDLIVDGVISLQTTVTVELQQYQNFEFSIDNPFGPYQNSNVFQNVAPGIHTAYIRDVNQCEVVEAAFSVIGHPAFFTPNNDGFNDYWQIQGVNAELQSESIVYIYDRYGNLLAQVDPASPGWDGNQNGRPLPSSDYWFSVSLEDGRAFKGHFALKR